MSKTILVVDDEMLIALDIQSQLEELGHRVLVVVHLDDAVALVQHQEIDVAIVDWHLRDEISAPLTDLLKQRQVPFVLCSGSSIEELAGLFPTVPILMKPFLPEDLLGALSRVAGEGTPH